jgi:nucleotide-binding universal stress UspA family protein
MSSADREGSVPRILVALDASPHSLAALRAAAELAADLDAELVGIFVEDINLLRLSDLPLASEVTIYTTTSRRLNRQEIERQLRSQARMAQRALEEIARRRRVRWSFQVAQGIIASELLAAAADTDIILLGKSGWSQRRRLGSTTRVIVTQAPNQIFILQEGAHLGLPVGVLYDGSPNAQKSLVAAANLLRRQDGFLVVVILADHVDKARQFQAEISEWAQEEEIHIHYRWLVDINLGRLMRIVHGEHCGVMVLPAEGIVFQGEDLVELLEETDCPVLLVR